MYGRYGNDDLNKFLLYVSIGLVILNLFIRVRALHVLIILLLIVIFARAWSRYFDKRQQENMKFLEIKNKIFGGRGFGKKNKNGNGSGAYDYAGNGTFRKTNGKPKDYGKRVLICPYCKEKLRVPVGAGKIKINCPHCHKQFDATV